MEKVKGGHIGGRQGIRTVPLVVTSLTGVLEHLFKIENCFLQGLARIQVGAGVEARAGVGRGVDDIWWGRHQWGPASPGWRGRGCSFPQRLGPSCNRGRFMLQGLDLSRFLNNLQSSLRELIGWCFIFLPWRQAEEDLHGLCLSTPGPLEFLEVSKGWAVILRALCEHVAVSHKVQVDMVSIRAAMAPP